MRTFVGQRSSDNFVPFHILRIRPLSPTGKQKVRRTAARRDQDYSSFSTVSTSSSSSAVTLYCRVAEARATFLPRPTLSCLESIQVGRKPDCSTPNHNRRRHRETWEMDGRVRDGFCVLFFFSTLRSEFRPVVFRSNKSRLMLLMLRHSRPSVELTRHARWRFHKEVCVFVLFAFTDVMQKKKKKDLTLIVGRMAKVYVGEEGGGWGTSAVYLQAPFTRRELCHIPAQRLRRGFNFRLRGDVPTSTPPPPRLPANHFTMGFLHKSRAQIPLREGFT